ncbi:unnamed protein product, partial [Meganyctiphanes norvegica]
GVALNPADGVASYHILGERAHVPTVYTMAHLPSAELAARRQAAFQDILREWQPMQGSDWYAIQCPCRPDCGCIPSMKCQELFCHHACMWENSTIFSSSNRSWHCMASESDGIV